MLILLVVYLAKNQNHYKASHSIFENHALADLGVLIVNTTIIDKNDENTELLVDYVLAHIQVGHPASWYNG
jgi:uncharacterized radical SAM superfamily Fe-S cluster-containing enzyme